MNSIKQEIVKLCTPSKIYFYLAGAVLAIGLLIFIVAAFSSKNTFIGSFFDSKLSAVPFAFLFGVSFLFLLLWTWILNELCVSGYTSIAWGVLLLIMLRAFWNSMKK